MELKVTALENKVVSLERELTLANMAIDSHASSITYLDTQINYLHGLIKNIQSK